MRAKHDVGLAQVESDASIDTALRAVVQGQHRGRSVVQSVRLPAPSRSSPETPTGSAGSRPPVVPHGQGLTTEVSAQAAPLSGSAAAGPCDRRWSCTGGRDRRRVGLLAWFLVSDEDRQRGPAATSCVGGGRRGAGSAVDRTVPRNTPLAADRRDSR